MAVIAIWASFLVIVASSLFSGCDCDKMCWPEPQSPVSDVRDAGGSSDATVVVPMDGSAPLPLDGGLDATTPDASIPESLDAGVPEEPCSKHCGKHHKYHGHGHRCK